MGQMLGAVVFAVIATLRVFLFVVSVIGTLLLWGAVIATCFVASWFAAVPVALLASFSTYEAIKIGQSLPQWKDFLP